ncbi:NAD(P)H-dependent glycerol-3-phosphate dehydrogenase [Olivibacter domesticus]|uniref:Glycerol-3-phosphate dehydrogenase [NAD(P)+] n=1 Tax=Olivibacter domesticus TaxID=407022 RepID=A0A1H7L9I0_OLID1|nr:NAD(P)H-dependent glycerol-3-phosphate dehydrogenase [Olivibacter domesticus]SEK94937.1 glycerol-3-phosphate dehydrogenase (NAD(P)+) [Olivibacter domesticus]
MQGKKTIAVIGGGSWATAIVKMLSDNEQDKHIYWWMRNKEAITSIRTYHHNPNYLSAVEVKIPAEQVTDDLHHVIDVADLIVLSVPAAFLIGSLQNIKPEQLKNKYIISAIKGIVPEENQIVGDYLQSTFNIPIDQIAVISGPCHAEEVSLEKLSYLTIASASISTAEIFSSCLNTRYIKTILSDDIYGTEYGAVLKNIYAVASGICHGVGYGDNFQAVLISNAIREMARFLASVHPIGRDINESAYLGDLLVTAYSQFSRNRTFGNMIGKGYTVRSAQLEMNMIAEGYYASKCIHQINKAYQVDMPICRAVYAVLYERHSPHIEMKLLADQLT